MYFKDVIAPGGLLRCSTSHEH